MVNTRQKGRAFSLKIIDILNRDAQAVCHEVVGSGSGNREKGDIRCTRYGLVVEAKDQKQINLAQWTKQADSQVASHEKSVVMWRHPKSPSANPEIRVDMDISYFIELLLKSGDPQIKREDRDFLYKVKRLKQSAHDVIKELE